jgi:hypothetical protein
MSLKPLASGPALPALVCAAESVVDLALAGIEPVPVRRLAEAVRICGEASSVANAPLVVSRYVSTLELAS